MGRKVYPIVAILGHLCGNGERQLIDLHREAAYLAKHQAQATEANEAQGAKTVGMSQSLAHCHMRRCTCIYYIAHLDVIASMAFVHVT